MSDGVDFWNDYMVWSGGHPSDNAMRFDIVIAGKTTNDDYISFEGDKLVSGTYVYWTAAVNNQMGPNQILELMLKLNTPGSTTPPEVGSYGDLIIEGELVNWGDIVYEEIPM
jgi:hypothetical protein